MPKCVSATSRLGIPTVPEWCTVSTTVFSKPCSAPPSVCNEIFAGPAAAFGTTRGYLLSLSLPAVFPSPACDGVCFCGIQTTRQCGGTRPRIELDGLCIHSLLSLDNGKKNEGHCRCHRQKKKEQKHKQGSMPNQFLKTISLPIQDAISKKDLLRPRRRPACAGL